MKVVWLCHFINKEFNEFFGTNLNEVAPWITDFIRIIGKNDEIKLHVVAPNYYTNKNITIKKDNIHYHFYKYFSNCIPTRKMAYLESVVIKDFFSVRNVKKIVDSINPSLIHLFGSENIFYSRSILQFKDKCEVLISIQGFICQAPKAKGFFSKLLYSYRKRNEFLINSKFKNFSIVTTNGAKTIDKVNPNAIKYTLPFPTKNVRQIDNIPYEDKKYDLIFWGRVTRNKGVEDFIEAVEILKNKYCRKINAIIIGGASDSYFSVIKSLVKKKNLESNIVFTGFLQSQEEVFQYALNARVYVLPTYFDSLPGSIREALLLKIPVVTYNIGGIPDFNKENECVTLAKYRDIDNLVLKILLVMNDRERTKRISSNGYNLVQRELSNNKIEGKIMEIYNDIIPPMNRNK